ncbi:MAG: hypothetical protein HYW50_02410 [Candidatus Diapherotrites archaeon]|nr:hypothetical protein [Candidatus Diapherotrites archaeon]
MPVQFVRGKYADYVIEYLKFHPPDVQTNLPGKGLTTRQGPFDAYVSEYQKGKPVVNKQGVYDREVLRVFSTVIAHWKEMTGQSLIDRPIDIFFPDAQLTPEEVNEIKRMRRANSLFVPAGLALFGPFLKHLFSGAGFKRKKENEQPLPRRRDFLRDIGIFALISSGFSLPALQARADLRSSFMIAGRSAIAAEWLEELGKAKSEQLGGKRAKIAVFIGDLHPNLEKLIQNQTERQRVLNKFSNRLRQIPPELRKAIYGVRRNPQTGKLENLEIPVPDISEKIERRSSQRRRRPPSRREALFPWTRRRRRMA